MADPVRLTDYSDPKRWLRMTLEDVQTPKPGRIVHGPAYWAVLDGCVLFFKSHASPQCNQSEAIVRRIRPDVAEVVHLPVTYIPHNCAEYV